MKPTITQIDASAEVAGPVEAVFAHWMDTDARRRYEAPEASGMRYRNFAPEQGGVEEIEISHGGAVIGEMMQRIVVLAAPHLIVSQITGTFGGKTTMAIQVTMHFEQTETGTRIQGTGQVVDTTGRDIKPEHEAGWAQLFAQFAADFKAHGPAA